MFFLFGFFFESKQFELDASVRQKPALHRVFRFTFYGAPCILSIYSYVSLKATLVARRAVLNQAIVKDFSLVKLISVRKAERIVVHGVRLIFDSMYRGMVVSVRAYFSPSSICGFLSSAYGHLIVFVGGISCSISHKRVWV